MRALFTIFLISISLSLIAQSTGDTIVIPTYNYSQTHGWPWCGFSRDTMIDFPNDPGVSYEKIIMAYNMRCKDGLVSVPGNTNLGCGEWDYSCNTYIHDSSRVDSVISFTNSHTITNFSGSVYNYVETPTYNYYQYLQKNVQIDQTISETLSQVGNGTEALSEVIKADQNSGKSQYLLTQAELSGAGVISGDIDGILLQATSGADVGYLMIKIKPTEKTELTASSPDLEGFTEVYFHDYNFIVGSNRIQFHTPFAWDGTSNLIIEISFTNRIASNVLEITGGNTTMISGLYTNNGRHLENIGGYIQIPTDPFSGISEEITISFWSYGNENIQPINNSFIHGVDGNGNRTVNVHLPWSNSNVYWDCGNDGGTYDRIYAAATADQYEGRWNHWAATKNAITGEMNLYYNGELWLSGADKSLLIDIQDFVIGNNGAGASTYFGKIDEVRVWDTELSEAIINEWMYKSVDNSHPDYNNLVAYYKIDEGNGYSTMDASPYGKTGQINGFMYWLYERGDDLNHGFSETTERPNITIAQGDYALTITDVIVTDSVANYPNIVTEYEIIPRWGTMLNDSINPVSVNEFWEAVYEVTYDPEGIAIDSSMVEATGSIEPIELQYYKRYPAKYEIMSFVTPYGIYLDLGMEGKTWYFDVTDYAPILQGTKRMTIERGGEWQEDMDIKFYFITGTPPHDILDIKQIWRADSKSYTDIQNARAFETRDIQMLPDGESFKLMTVISGHGQEGEFTPRHHTMNIDGGDIEFDQVVWTECSTIPIYPQGGTWVYDRAGWCPGDPSDIHEYDITPFVSPGQTHSFDYNVTYATGTSNYIVRQHLVTYGPPNFNLDAAIVKILKPNKDDASQERFNPACTYPEIVIQNTGSTTLTSLDIEYYVEGGNTENYEWTGSLEFLEKETVILPIPELTFWLGTFDKFTVNISNPNGQSDQYTFNNSCSSFFDEIHVYPEGGIITIQLKTNNVGYQTTYTLYDGEGNIHYQRDDCDNNTVYNDEFYLFPGCYKLRIDDSGDNGLDFWHQPSQGTGYFRIKDSDGATLYTFDPDFGGFAEFEFGIGNITKLDEVSKPFTISVYPNPTTEKIHLKVKGLGNTKASMSLLNSLSSKVMEKEWSVIGEDFNTEIDMGHLPSGIYFLQFNYGDHSITEKIIKQ
ncbi:MAG: T9SS type A sorting domain-containing protein [Bacteroidetes bacterium]|nr:T9SS type A sorting domain-containing protein [Bacteroidota bacterium]